MKRLLFLLLIAVIPLSAAAQNYQAAEVTISNEKANIAGKVYYIHKVLPKQTVFSICKAYGVTEDELKAANPDLKAGLKAGSIIFVPATGKIQQPAQPVKKEKQPAPAPKPVEVKEAAPDTAAQAKATEVVRVIEHRVRWYESLAGIARKYGISEAEILDYNGLQASDAIRGTVLLIPVTAETDIPDDELLAEQPGDEEESVAEEETTPAAPMPPVRKVRWFNAAEPLHIALVLPFNATGGRASSNFLDFYSGALMALQEQKEKGAHVILNVYDLAQGSQAILDDRKFQESDLVIGPVEAATVEPFLTFCDREGIPFVSPLDHKVDSLVDTYPFLFQVPASVDRQVRNLVAGLRGHNGDRVILAAGTSAADAELVETMEACLQAEAIPYRKVGLADLSAQASSGSRNRPVRVLLGSEGKSFTTQAIRSLNALAKRGIPVEVWCTNRVRNYEQSDPDALFNLSAHIAAPYFIDYSNPADQAFVRQFRALYRTEPDEFAFQGHDVLTYFISSMMRQGSAFADQADMSTMQLLQASFQFQRDHNESGWRNCATRHLVYDKDTFSIVIAK